MIDNHESDPYVQNSKPSPNRPFVGQIIDSVTGEMYMPPGARITAFAVDTPSRTAQADLDELVRAFPPTIVKDENWKPVSEPR
jgi:hypothetical protein